MRDKHIQKPCSHSADLCFIMSAVCGGGGAADAWMNHTDAEVKKKKKIRSSGVKGRSCSRNLCVSLPLGVRATHTDVTQRDAKDNQSLRLAEELCDPIREQTF